MQSVSGQHCDITVQADEFKIDGYTTIICSTLMTDERKVSLTNCKHQNKRLNAVETQTHGHMRSTIRICIIMEHTKTRLHSKYLHH